MKYVDIFGNFNIEWNGKVRSLNYFFIFIFCLFLATLDSTKIIEVLEPDTVIFFQVHKRIWPAAQRDSCFWSHIRCISNLEEDQPTWLVINYTTPHPMAPVREKV